MASFLVETFTANVGGDGAERMVCRARATARALGAPGAAVRHLWTYVLPGDEMCVHVVEADSVESVLRASELAGIEVERVVEAIGVPGRPGEGEPAGARPRSAEVTTKEER